MRGPRVTWYLDRPMRTWARDWYIDIWWGPFGFTFTPFWWERPRIADRALTIGPFVFMVW